MVTDRLDALARALGSLPRLLAHATEQVVQDNATELELDNQQQLAEGLDSRGRDIVPEYALGTVVLKQEKGQPYDRVTLRDRGDFYRGIVAQVRGGQVELVGTDVKTAELEQKYGPDILGVSEPDLEAFREDLLRPELNYQARRALDL